LGHSRRPPAVFPISRVCCDVLTLHLVDLWQARTADAFARTCTHTPRHCRYLEGTDFIVIRELTGGIYFGDRKEDTGDGKAFDMMVYTVPEVERITRCAAKIAMGWV
jgi:isocitrate/isopropylmalate dehydrogenase